MNIREQLEEMEARNLSPYASLSRDTRGRDREEKPCDIRPAYQRDRDRILHCKSFRRLKHKTQVFLSPVELYGYWLQHRQAITDGYQALEAKVPLQRGLYLLFRNLARGFRRLRKGKRGR